jgi:hypothetical protein
MELCTARRSSNQNPKRPFGRKLMQNKLQRVTIHEAMKQYPLLIVLTLGTLPLAAYQKEASTALPKSAAPDAAVSATRAVASGPSDQEKIQDLQQRIRKIEEKSDSSTAVAIIGAVATIIGAFVVFGSAYVAATLGNKGQILASERAERLARDEVLYRRAEQVVEFRMKQVQNFYAPMFALLRQSKDLYDKMLEQLAQEEPARYRKNPDAVGSDFRYQVFHKGKWEKFYLLDQLPAIKGNARAVALVDGMIAIGRRICKVISSNAGYAAEDLVETLGKYMAHYAILKSIRNGPETEPFEPGFHKVGYFPYGIDTKVSEAYHSVSKSIDEYRRTSAETLKMVAEGKN